VKETLKDGRKIPPFVMIETAVFGRVDPNAFTVYAVICKFANNTTRQAWPSHQTIADLAGCSRSTVKKAIATLKKAKLISVKKKGSVGKEHNVYTILSPAKNKGKTRSPKNRGESPRNRGGSQENQDPVATQPETILSGTTLNEIDPVNENRATQVCANAQVRVLASPSLEEDLPVIPEENYANLVKFLFDECGFVLDERGRGALRVLWDDNASVPDEEREGVVRYCLEEALRRGCNTARSLFAVSLKVSRNELCAA
jgi:hypothetical protein